MLQFYIRKAKGEKKDGEADTGIRENSKLNYYLFTFPIQCW